MKKLFALAALVLGLAACQTEPEGLDVNVGGEVETTVCVSLPETTRANSAVGAFANLNLEQDSELTVRYIFQVFYNETGVQKQVYYTDGQSASFPVRLVPGRHYNFVAWADIVEQPTDDKMNKALPYDGNTTDVHYNTTNLKAITLLGEWNAMDETRDAYTGFHNTADPENEKYTGSSSINIQMTRPFAKLRVLTTDMVELGNLGIVPEGVKVKYTVPVYNSFNALNGAVNNTTVVDKVFEYNLTDDDVEKYEATQTTKTLFTNYLFGAENGVIKFEMSVYDNTTAKELIKFNNFSTDIPVQRNYLTTISGNILTDGNKIKVTVDDVFENADKTTDEPYYQETISSVAELLTAIDAGGEYILISNLDVNGVTTSALAATRATGASTTINLNGYTITLKRDIEVKSGNTLIINNDPADNAGNELGKVVNEGGKIINKGTLNIEGGNFGANTIENNNGVVNITGGTINGDLSDFVPDGYDVEKNEDGSYTVTESEPVAQIGNETYTTLQAAFDAVNGEARITLLRDATFKNTSVLANGKTVVLELGGYTLSATDKNVIRNDGGNLTIKNGTIRRTGDVVGYSVNNASGEITVESATITRGLYTSGSKMTATNANISHEQSSRHAIYAWNCEVTINSGTYHNDNAGNATLMASGSSVVTINGGTFSIADGRETLSWTSCLMDQNNTAKITVKGGEFNGGFRINSADTKLTIEGGEFNTNNGSGYTYYNGTVSIEGGTYTDNAAIAFAEKYVAEGYVLDGNTVVLDVKVAKVGYTEYRKIDDAIAAWTNNTTLTLLSDVTLTDVIKISSTEMHTLDLGTFTLTSAKGKNAIEIINNGRSSASYALDIKADATNPGGITASSAVVKTTGKSGVKDRPIIRFYNGVFDASNIINHGGSSGTNSPQFMFYNGVYNGNITTNRAICIFEGGTFNGRFFMSVDSSSYARIGGGKFKYMDNLYGSALNSEKFTIGSAKKVFDRGVYVDAEGYIVVGGPVITDFGDKFTAKATNASKAGSYLQYSSAADNGLYYEDADMAIKKHGEANVVLK